MLGPQSGQDASARDAWDLGSCFPPTVDSFTAWVWGPQSPVKDAQD